MLHDWQRLFPEADYRFQMSLRPGDEARFWKARPDAAAVLRERRRWLAERPGLFTALLPEGAMCVAEAIERLTRFAADEARDHRGDEDDPGDPRKLLFPWGTGVSPVRHRQDAFAPDMVALGGQIEPDWVVLSPDAERDFPIFGGVVVFPSSWALTEKIGRPLYEVHDPAPGVNDSLGKSISTFLSRLQPGAAWERENWGLAADDALNHHPEEPRARLDDSARLDTTWLRLERQILLRLPRTGGILFGIRVSNHRLDALAAIPGLAPRLARALATMPEAIARYKGLAQARAPLAVLLATPDKR